jgi:hypothetical protein
MFWPSSTSGRFVVADLSFNPPRKGSTSAKKFQSAVNARVAPKRNDARRMDSATHFARAQQNLLAEWHAYHEQLNFSGDDMNIIQVGRPAVSRYHQTRKFNMNGKGVDYDVHDFPTAELGMKLGGFMVLSQTYYPAPDK